MRAVVIVLAVMAGPLAAQEGKPLDPDALAACEAAGGYAARGLRPDEICVLPTVDAGKECTTNADCESFCLAETATCGEWKPLFGCHEVLVGDGQSATICLD